MGLSGVQRTLKFAKFLPQFGWQPTVLTVTPTGYFAQDYTLLDELHPLRIHIERVGSLDPNRLFRTKGIVRMPSERSRKLLTFLSDTFFIPDNKIGWKRAAIKAASALYEKTRFDIIFATAPPFTDLLVGAELHRQFKTPLVVDYRDPWLDYPLKYYPTPLHKWSNYRLEKQVLRAASRIITTNRRVKELILKHYRFLQYNDVTILPQGYDPADFSTPDSHRKNKRMRITHAGVFYGNRTPEYFLRALNTVFTKRPDLRDRIEMCFVGNMLDEHAKIISRLGLDGNVIATGYLDHRRCVEQIQSSDILWLMLRNDSQSPGKFYEYLAARKPVIACVPDGFIRQTIEEAEAGVCLDPEDVDGIVGAILQYAEQFERGSLPTPREDVVAQFDRAKLTYELSKIFGFLTES
jgi:glycosyltransferase involved in cell wall biosynthesis